MAYDRQTREIAGRECLLYGEADAKYALLQAVDAHDAEGLTEEVEAIRQLTGNAPFRVCAFRVANWDRELTPWSLPENQAFHGNTFGDGAGETLAYVREGLMPALLEERTEPVPPVWLLGGYSLAGLFALWAGYQTDAFQGIAGVSPSVWYPMWEEYIDSHAMRAKSVYLSLGDKEEKSRGLMGRVGDGIRGQYARLNEQDGVRCTLEWNPGNHFRDASLRTAKGFAWLMGAGE